jgi:hypothetical protein
MFQSPRRTPASEAVAVPGGSVREARRIAFVVPYGEASESYFPDTLLSWLSARARRAGHQTRVFRVYYDGQDEARDNVVRGRLVAALDALAPTDILVERVFDLAPLLAVRARHGCRLVMVCRGDGFDPDPRLDGWIGRAPGLSRGRTRRTPTIGAIARELDAWLEGRQREEPDTSDARTLPPVELDLEHTLIGVGDLEALRTPRVRTLFGNAGCPYAADPRKVPFYAGLSLLAEDDGDALSLLGCAFCPMGGDYERAEPRELVAWVAAQARTIRETAPGTEGFVLSDQAPLPYLAELIHETRALAPVRWLVAMRADALVRETARLERAIAAAENCGHRVSLYLTGFESFADAELERYAKGVTAAELVASVHRMRALARAHPGSFGCDDDRGHSLILWSPWTSLSDLEESLGTIRRHGLRQLFTDLGRNRLRLTHELPITQAAERDGALLEAWPEGHDGAARTKGYATERPWRFLDAETALAQAIAEGLRARLGRETELAQLRAAAAFARGRGAAPRRPLVEESIARLARFEAALARWLAGSRSAGEPRRGRFLRAEVVDLGMPCGCGRETCAERDAFVEPATAHGRLAQALAKRPEAIVLAGGDALTHPEIASLARAVCETSVPLGLCVPTAPPSGRPAPPACDALSLDVASELALEAGAEGIAAMRAVTTALEARLLLSGELVRARAAAALVGAIAKRFAPDVLRVVAPLDAIGLDALDDATVALAEVAQACNDAGLAMEVSPLAAGPTWRVRMATRVTPTRTSR